MNDTYRIVLADGTEINDLRLNGNNFVSDDPIDETIFEGNLSPVTIYHGLVPEVHEHMELVQVTQMHREYWFILRDITPEELAAMQVRADIDFLAMMTDVEL